MKTRTDYLAGNCSHREYYGQFVTENIKNYVVSMIGKRAILEATDPHLNDIALQKWDQLTAIRHMINTDKWREVNCCENQSTYPWSLSDQVCIAKEAARQFIDEVKR